MIYALGVECSNVFVNENLRCGRPKKKKEEEKKHVKLCCCTHCEGKLCGLIAMSVVYVLYECEKNSMNPVILQRPNTLKPVAFECRESVAKICCLCSFVACLSNNNNNNNDGNSDNIFTD